MIQGVTQEPDSASLHPGYSDFVVYAGAEHNPKVAGIEAIGLRELAAVLPGMSGAARAATTEPHPAWSQDLAPAAIAILPTG